VHSTVVTNQKLALYAADARAIAFANVLYRVYVEWIVGIRWLMIHASAPVNFPHTPVAKGMMESVR
jgi:hypothetical protein